MTIIWWQSKSMWKKRKKWRNNAKEDKKKWNGDGWAELRECERAHVYVYMCRKIYKQEKEEKNITTTCDQKLNHICQWSKLLVLGRSHSHAYNARTIAHTHTHTPQASQSKMNVEREIRILECGAARTILFVSIFIVLLSFFIWFDVFTFAQNGNRFAYHTKKNRKCEQNQGQIILAVFHLFHVAYLFI